MDGLRKCLSSRIKLLNNQIVGARVQTVWRIHYVHALEVIVIRNIACVRNVPELSRDVSVTMKLSAILQSVLVIENHRYALKEYAAQAAN